MIARLLLRRAALGAAIAVRCQEKSECIENPYFMGISEQVDELGRSHCVMRATTQGLLGYCAGARAIRLRHAQAHA